MAVRLRTGVLLLTALLPPLLNADRPPLEAKHRAHAPKGQNKSKNASRKELIKVELLPTGLLHKQSQSKRTRHHGDGDSEKKEHENEAPTEAPKNDENAHTEAPKKENENETHTEVPESNQETPNEEQLENEEKSAFGKGIGMMAQAMTDPRGFLLQLDVIKKFVQALKFAVDNSKMKGYCLYDGEFKDFGCINDHKAAQICQCSGWLAQCYVPEDTSKVVKMWTQGNKQQAFDLAKTLLLGQCYTPVWAIVLSWSVAILVLFILIYCIASKVRGRRDDDD